MSLAWSRDATLSYGTKIIHVSAAHSLEAARRGRSRTGVRGLHLVFLLELRAPCAGVRGSLETHHEAGGHGAGRRRVVSGRQPLQARVLHAVGVARRRESSPFRPRRQPPRRTPRIRAGPAAQKHLRLLQGLGTRAAALVEGRPRASGAQRSAGEDMMKSVLGLVCAGVLAGIVGATVFRVARPVLAQGPQAAQAGGRPGQPPRIPPLASPPLYPDQKPTVIVWTSADMKKVYDARVAAARGVTSATAAPRFESLQTRTHGVSLFFRTKFDSPRPATRS